MGLEEEKALDEALHSASQSFKARQQQERKRQKRALQKKQKQQQRGILAAHDSVRAAEAELRDQPPSSRDEVISMGMALEYIADATSGAGGGIEQVAVVSCCSLLAVVFFSFARPRPRPENRLP